VKRRSVVTLVVAGVALPDSAMAQSPSLPVVGFLNGASPAAFEHLVRAFREGLSEAGFVPGRNVEIEYRWAEGRFDKLAPMANDLVQRQVAVIVATGGARAALAAKVATSSIPIIFSSGGDPVVQGLVSSLSRPSGNLTGVSLATRLLESKRLELLHQALPQATTFALLTNPGMTSMAASVKDVEGAARRLGVRIIVLKSQSANEFEAVFETLVQQRAQGLVVSSDAFFNSRREQLVELAARHKVPAIYEFREFAQAGGLMSYGTHLAQMYRQIGVYTGRILNGAKPADLPILQPTRFELVINLKTAKALGITIPPSLLLRADEVIE
jgi:putative tryptophan/tyrosine transport system substrate-binding protein